MERPARTQPRDCTTVNIPIRAGLALGVAKLSELIEALQRGEIEARRREWV